MAAVAIITARGGSKRIPKKNIKNFCGKPIIAYSIEAAIESGLFDKVMVSTDSDEIAEIAKRYGAEVPFMRSEKTSNDYADTSDVLLEVLAEYEKRGSTFKEFCCIYPTAPFVTPVKLKESYELLISTDAANVVPMVPFSFPPQRGLVKRGDYMEPAYPEYIEYRSQDLEPILHDCGQFYWCRVEDFKKNQDLLYNKTVPYLVPETEVQDIDNQSDWLLAEIKYRFMKEGQ